MLKSRPLLTSLAAKIRQQAPRAMSTATPSFAAGSDTAALSPVLKELVSRPEAPWHLTATGEGVERSFRFKTFAKTWVRCALPPSSPDSRFRPRDAYGLAGLYDGRLAAM